MPKGPLSDEQSHETPAPVARTKIYGTSFVIKELLPNINVNSGDTITLVPENNMTIEEDS
jgi:hypothetical protein